MGCSLLANLFLVPALAYILPGAQLQYSAKPFRGSRILQVSGGVFIISKLVPGASPGLHPTQGPAPVLSQPVPGLQDYTGTGILFIISKPLPGASPRLHPTRGPSPVLSQPVPGLQDYTGILWGVHY